MVTLSLNRFCAVAWVACLGILYLARLNGYYSKSWIWNLEIAGWTPPPWVLNGFVLSSARINSSAALFNKWKTCSTSWALVETWTLLEIIVSQWTLSLIPNFWNCLTNNILHYEKISVIHIWQRTSSWSDLQVLVIGCNEIYYAKHVSFETYMYACMVTMKRLWFVLLN